ncbi:Lcp5p [Sugiyamaella lignohabitans]|uniref:Lcp5p n=1 Tax=Sugiyamaella lignohabitans TaxID=796027 RepID=A0A167EQY7_9ASCO|nr:Lcp5p [Sugiyamaella lignohabitans]ANB14365.1 Lcp5p [Sugiyamaella lignohabitans]
MDALLETINTSITSLTQSIDDGTSFSDESIAKIPEGISLLALKNDTMLSYLHNVILIIAGKLSLASTDDNESEKDVAEIIRKATEASVTQRVVLEKGVKGLETKIAYQIEKVLRAHSKLQQEAEQKQQQLAEDEVNGQADKEEEVDSDSDDDALNFKPNPMALKGANDDSAEGDRRNGIRSKDPAKSSSSTEKYKAPKIAAVTPFSKEQPKGRKQRNSTMEEYIREMSTAPLAEPSVGSTIMDNGRGGERTERDRAKQKEVQNYEEENYTRLQGLSQKQEKRAARQRQRDAFGKSLFGEDWSFLDRKSTNSGVSSSSKRNKQSSSVWERTKKRQRR